MIESIRNCLSYLHKSRHPYLPCGFLLIMLVDIPWFPLASSLSYLAHLTDILSQYIGGEVAWFHISDKASLSCCKILQVKSYLLQTGDSGTNLLSLLGGIVPSHASSRCSIVGCCLYVLRGEAMLKFCNGLCGKKNLNYFLRECRPSGQLHRLSFVFIGHVLPADLCS
jgi:hypothetical protein